MKSNMFQQNGMETLAVRELSSDLVLLGVHQMFRAVVSVLKFLTCFSCVGTPEESTEPFSNYV